MHKTHDGCYRHRQFRIERDPDCSLTPSRDYNGWFVLPTDDYMGVMIPDSTEPFRTLAAAVDSIDRAIAADLRCPEQGVNQMAITYKVNTFNDYNMVNRTPERWGDDS